MLLELTIQHIASTLIPIFRRT